VSDIASGVRFLDILDQVT